MGLKFKGCPQKPVAFCGLLPESPYNTHMHKNIHKFLSLTQVLSASKLLDTGLNIVHCCYLDTYVSLSSSDSEHTTF